MRYKHRLNVILIILVLFSTIVVAEELNEERSRELCNAFEALVKEELSHYDIRPKVKDLTSVNLFVMSCNLEHDQLKLEFAYRYEYKGDYVCCKKALFSGCVPHYPREIPYKAFDLNQRGSWSTGAPDKIQNYRREHLQCDDYVQEKVEKEVPYELSADVVNKTLFLDRSYRKAYYPIFDFINELVVRFLARR